MGTKKGGERNMSSSRLQKGVRNAALFALLLGASTGFSTLTASADSSIRVTINGAEISYDQPPVVVADRTLVPLRGIFESLGASVAWDGASQTVTASKGNQHIVLKIGSKQAYINQISYILDAPAQILNDRTLVPIRFVSEALGATVQWNGPLRTVEIETPRPTSAPDPSVHPVAAPSVPAPPVQSDPFSQPYVLPDIKVASLMNEAKSDADYWQRASNNFYLSIQTNDPAQSGIKPTAKILNAQPGQPLYLFASSDTDIPNLSTNWIVNSPDATFTTNSNYTWKTSKGLQTAETTFVANKPGIYTVQAQYNGKSSIPMVVLVGINQLTGQPISVDSRLSGVQPLAQGLVSTSSNQRSELSYQTYDSINGWIPVSGHVNSAVQSIVVELDADGSDTKSWNYSLPVASDGTFSAMVRSPFHGKVNVSYYIHFMEGLNSGQLSTDAYYATNVSTPDLDDTHKGLLSSAQMEYNLDPKFNAMASVLLENSPSLKTGIAAISNYVSESIFYDLAAVEANKIALLDSRTAWAKGVGICQDYARLSASLLKSAGIPVLTIGGPANNGTANSNILHEWGEAWTGSDWLILDPTWDSPVQDGLVAYIQNQYFTNTEALSSSHQGQWIGSDS